MHLLRSILCIKDKGSVNSKFQRINGNNRLSIEMGIETMFIRSTIQSIGHEITLIIITGTICTNQNGVGEAG